MTDLSRKNFLRFLATSIGSLYLSGCINQDKLLFRSSSPEKITPTPFLPGPQNTVEADPTLKPEEMPTQEPSTTPVPVYPDLVAKLLSKPDSSGQAGLEVNGREL